MPSLTVRRGSAIAAAVAVLAAAALAVGQANEPAEVAAPNPSAAPVASELHSLDDIRGPGLYRTVPGLEQATQSPSPATQSSASPSAIPTATPIPSATPIPTAATKPEDLPVEAVAYRPGPGLHTEGVLALVVQHFPADQIGNAMAVARCESGHSNAIGAVNNNGTRDWGVFQLNDGGTLQGALRRIGMPFSTTAQAQELALDAAVNVRAAATIYASRGWAPWVCAYKAGIVASLYSSTPGPMDGRYDERGLPGQVDLGRTVPDAEADIPQPAVSDAPSPTPSASPSPAPSQASPPPTAAASPNPTTAPGDAVSPSPSASPSPTESGSPSATPDPTPSDTETTPAATAAPSAESTADVAAPTAPSTASEESPTAEATATTESPPTGPPVDDSSDPSPTGSADAEAAASG